MQNTNPALDYASNMPLCNVEKLAHEKTKEKRAFSLRVGLF